MDIALGLEISEDRRHTSIAAVGHLDAEFVMVELVAYLVGTDAVAEVVKLRAERTVVVVAVDPRSPGATLIAPLTAAGIEVAQPSTSDLAVAHGEFLDAASAGRLRHTGQPELDAAVRHGTQRPLAGAQTWNRRGVAVDVAPLTAATLALWALLHAPRAPFFAARWEA